VPSCSTRRFDCERIVASDHQHVVVVGEVDIDTRQRLTDALREAQEQSRHVVLDLAGTTFLDTSGARVLLAAAAHARATAATFEIVRPSAAVTRLLALIGADRALEA
jgi:anti-anti-sigma factor